MDIAVFGTDFSRRMHLQRHDDGRWTADVEQHGSLDAAAAGIRPDLDLTGALDIDLALCPVTNTMPMLRLGALTERMPETDFTMAWIDLPSLEVICSHQIYDTVSTLSADGVAEVRYQSGERDFERVLTVDADGLVIDYPTLARRALTTDRPR